MLVKELVSFVFYDIWWILLFQRIWISIKIHHYCLIILWTCMIIAWISWLMFEWKVPLYMCLQGVTSFRGKRAPHKLNAYVGHFMPTQPSLLVLNKYWIMCTCDVHVKEHNIEHDGKGIQTYVHSHKMIWISMVTA